MLGRWSTLLFEKRVETNIFRPRGWHRNCMDTVFQFLLCWSQVYWQLQSGHRWLRDPRTPQTELVVFFANSGTQRLVRKQAFELQEGHLTHKSLYVFCNFISLYYRLEAV